MTLTIALFYSSDPVRVTVSKCAQQERDIKTDKLDSALLNFIICTSTFPTVTGQMSSIAER